MSPSDRKKLWIAAVAVLLCAAAIAITLVLVLKKDSGSHIIEEKPIETVRGELDISLVRERLQSVIIDKEGLPKQILDDKFADYSNTNENIFGITDDILIAPRCYFSVNMAISNLKPYAFEYWLEIIPQNGDNLLVDQLELTVTVGGEEFVRRTLAGGLTTKIFPAVSAAETARFTVKLEYLDVKDNNETKNTTLAFDMIVHARLIQS